MMILFSMTLDSGIVFRVSLGKSCLDLLFVSHDLSLDISLLRDVKKALAQSDETQSVHQ